MNGFQVVGFGNGAACGSFKTTKLQGRLASGLPFVPGMSVIAILNFGGLMSGRVLWGRAGIE